MSKDNLIAELSQHKFLHTIGIWHDHSTIPGHEYIVVTVKAFYNSAVYKHDSELKDHQSFCNFQSHIELAQIF